MTVTHCPITKALAVWTVSDLDPVPMASEVVLVALVPGALVAEAALAAALTVWTRSKGLPCPLT